MGRRRSRGWRSGWRPGASYSGGRCPGASCVSWPPSSPPVPWPAASLRRGGPSTGRWRWPARVTARRACPREYGASPRARTRPPGSRATCLPPRPCERAPQFPFPACAYLLRASCASPRDSASRCHTFLIGRVGRSVRFDPVVRLLLQPPFLGQLLAAWSIEDLLRELRALLDLVRVGVTVGEVELRPQVGGMGADGFSQHFRGLVEVALRPGKLEKVAPPDDLRRSVQVVLVQPQRREDAVAKLSFQTLRERGDHPAPFPVHPASPPCL